MPVTTLPFTNGFYVSESLPVSAQQAINCYPAVAEIPSLNQEYVVGIPGVRQFATSGALRQISRGGWVMAGVSYVVNGDKLYRINSNGTMDALGVVEGTGRVSMVDNGTQLCVLIPGGKGYIYNKDTSVFTEITDSDFRANGDPLYVAFCDGYFVFTTDEDRFIISALNDGLSYNALDFGSAESDPDNVVAPIVYRNQLFVTGRNTTEGFQNIGGADFPFQRSGLFVDKGVFAPFSLIKSQDSFMFIGGGVNESPAVWMMAGGGVQKVSTNAIDNLLQRLTDDELSQVYAWSYAQKGNYFVGFALPDTTIVFDFSTKRWHERRSYVNSVNGPYRIASMMTAYGVVLCSDTVDGRIGVLDPDVYSEYGQNIIRVITSQPFQNNMQSVFFPSLELTIESGVGNSDDPEPVVVMERSKDGKLWDAPRPRPMGKVGQYNRRAIWRRNGRAARFEVFRFTCSDKVKFVAIQLTANVIGGDK